MINAKCYSAVYFFAVILSGVFLGFSFPNFNLFFLAYFFLVPLFFLADSNNYKKTFLSGIFSGLIGYSIILYWIYPTVVINTLSILQGLISIFLLTGYISIYLAFFLVAFKFLQTRVNCSHQNPHFFTTLTPVILSALWVSLEYFRTHFLTGFPWALIGYSQWNFLPVAQISEWTGIYGVSFFVVLINITLFQLLKKIEFKKIIPNLILIFIVLIYGVFQLSAFRFPLSADLKIAVIQPNIDQYKKWDKNYYTEVTEKIKSQVIAAADFQSDIILWPETSLTDVATPTETLSWLREVVSKSNRFNLVGAFWQEKDLIYNSAILLNPEGEIKYIHKKTHLVPFGEFVPFRKILASYFDVFNYMGDITRGKDLTKMSIDGKNFSVLICSENIFSHIVRNFVQNGAEAIVVITNNAWFGRTSAAFQHFTFNVFRAIENRRFIIQSANTGVSGVVSPSGKILKATDIFTDDYFFYEFPLIKDKTFYTKFGDIFAIICIILIFTFGLLSFKQLCKKSTQ